MSQTVDLAAPAPPATVLAAPGQPIQLIDGATVRLRYSMASLRVIEARFGSIAGIQSEIKAAQDAMKDAQENGTQGAQGRVFTILSDAIAAGLLHVRVLDPDTGRMVRLGASTELVMEQLDPGQLQPYLDAFGTALAEAFGTTGEAVGAALTAAATPSHGPFGTTSPPSPAGAPIGSSGA